MFPMVFRKIKIIIQLKNRYQLILQYFFYYVDFGPFRDSYRIINILQYFNRIPTLNFKILFYLNFITFTIKLAKTRFYILKQFLNPKCVSTSKFLFINQLLDQYSLRIFKFGFLPNRRIHVHFRPFSPLALDF